MFNVSDNNFLYISMDFAQIQPQSFSLRELESQRQQQQVTFIFMLWVSVGFAFWCQWCVPIVLGQFVTDLVICCNFSHWHFMFSRIEGSGLYMLFVMDLESKFLGCFALVFVCNMLFWS